MSELEQLNNNISILTDLLARLKTINKDIREQLKI
jgi:hypothetical protein